MVIPGQVHDGVIVPDGAPALPEGALVSITYPVLAESKSHHGKRRIQVPLVHSSEPGTVSLTSARIAEILDAEP